MKRILVPKTINTFCYFWLLTIGYFFDNRKPIQTTQEAAFSLLIINKYCTMSFRLLTMKY